MATNNLTASISLTDNITPQLRNISNAISAISATLSSLDFDKGLDPKACKQMMAAAQALDKSISDLEKDTEKATEEQDKHNRSLKEGKSSADNLSGGFKGLVGAIGGVIATYGSIQGIKSALDWSDQITQTTSRLRLVNDAFNQINGTSQTTKELQDKIFQAAQSSRGSYQDLEGLVASLGNNARDAFSSTDEMVKFAESLNKTFAISGASSEEMSNATLQLTQGLAAGALRGDELNSVLENAPELINVIANSMGVPRGEIRNLAAEGKITADVVKNALIGSSADIDAKFQSMDVTFGQLWTQFTNSALHAFEPVSAALGQLANNPEFQAALDTLGSAIADLAPKIADFVSSLAGAAPTVLTALVDGFSWILDNGERIGLLLSIIGGAFLAYQGYSFVSGIITSITLAMDAARASEEGLAIAQAALNLVMNANPISLIVTAIGALVGAIVYLWATNEDFRNAVMAANQAIIGAFQNAWAVISNVISAMAAGWDQAVAYAQNFWTNLTSTVSGWFTASVEWGYNLGMGLIEGLGSIWSNITNWFSENFGWIITYVKQIFGIASPSTVFNEIGANLLQGFWDGLKSIWEGMFSWVGGIWDSITSIFSGGGNDQTATFDFTAANQQLDSFNAKVDTVFNDIAQKSLVLGQTMVVNISSGLNQLPVAMAASFAIVQAALSVQIAAIVASAVNGFNGLIPAIGGVFQALSAQAVSLLNLLSANANNIILSLVASLTSAVMGLSQAFASGFSAIVSATATQLIVMKDQSVATMQIMAGSIQALFTALAQQLTTTFSTLCANLITALANLTSTFNSSWNSIRSSSVAIVNQMNSQILNAINKLVQDILNSMNRLKTEFGNTARDALSEFVKGLNTNAGQAVNAASDLVQKLKTTFETGLGIHSPSRFMQWVGEMMLAGLMKGMTPADVQSWIGNVIGDMQSSFEAGNFNAAETMDFLSQQGALDLIAKVTGMDLGEVENASPAAIPAIIQEALKYENYKGSGGLNGSSMFGLHYGNPGAWCVSFVRYCAEQVGVPFPATNYVPDVTAWAQANGRWTMTPQPGYAAIFSNRHIELVTDVYPDGRINYIGGNTGNGVVSHRPRGDATGFVALDGGHAVGNTLAAMLQMAYNAKYNPTPTGTAIGEGSVNWVPDAGVSQWTNIVQQALQRTGQPLSYTNDILYAIQRESSGNPNDTNNWDRNAAIGQNSRGLMQVIPDTFNSYRDPSLSNNIYDPLANVTAAIRYILDVYKSIPAMVNPRRASRTGWYGYAKGTDSASPGLHWVGEEGPELVEFKGGERVFTNQESMALVSGRNSGNSAGTYSGVTTNNTPVNVSVEIGTINNNKDLDFTIDKFSNMLCEVIDNVLYNEPNGIAVG